MTLQVYKMATLPVEISFINAPRSFDSSVLRYTLSKGKAEYCRSGNRWSAPCPGCRWVPSTCPPLRWIKVYEMPIELPENIHLLDNLDSITVSFDCSQMETKR